MCQLKDKVVEEIKEHNELRAVYEIGTIYPLEDYWSHGCKGMAKTNGEDICASRLQWWSEGDFTLICPSGEANHWLRDAPIT